MISAEGAKCNSLGFRFVMSHNNRRDSFRAFSAPTIILWPLRGPLAQGAVLS